MIYTPTWTGNNSRYEQIADQITAIQKRADECAWTFAEFQAEINRTIDADDLRAIRDHIGGELAYNARRFTYWALSTRWPDAAREAGRVVPNDIASRP